MNKRKVQYLRASNRALSGLLALLGFASCGGDTPWGGGTEEYGTPTTSYEIKGKVVNPEEKPIGKARVIVKRMYDGKLVDNRHYRDTVETNASGEYNFQQRNVSGMDFRVVCEDPGNTYEADSVDVKMDKPTGGKGWDKGKSSKEVNIRLTKEKNVK